MDPSASTGDDLLDVPNGDPAKFCRLCCSELDVEELFPDGQGIRQDVIDRIYGCTGIRITLEDDYPSAVCWICLMSLEEFQWFRDRCQRYDVLIRRKRKLMIADREKVPILVGNHGFPVVEEDDGDYDDDDDEDEPDGPVLRISAVQEKCSYSRGGKFGCAPIVPARTGGTGCQAKRRSAGSFCRSFHIRWGWISRVRGRRETVPV
ncbi:uncharacterized protein LOC110681416 [Aedes aegypti]|uniref:ZAD domain-containing protein n=1 Tax=Aedes aegypti TaxID=7159 RepID=A0A903VFA2_AEDAE|nr:uncharacterized protein LOC110681416 [Aedes aegypti]